MIELSEALASSTARMMARMAGSVRVGSSDQSVEFAPSSSVAASMAFEPEAIAGGAPFRAPRSSQSVQVHSERPAAAQTAALLPPALPRTGHDPGVGLAGLLRARFGPVFKQCGYR